MPHSLAPAIGRFVAAVLLVAVVTLSAAAPSRAQDAVDPQATARQLQEQRAEFKKLHQQLLLQKARLKLRQGQEHAALVKRAARGDKAAKRALASLPGARARKPVLEEPMPPAGADSPARPPAESASAQANASIPTNVRANTPGLDAANAGQCEEAIAVLGDNILVAWNDGQGFVTGGDTQGFGWSSDGGATFTDGGDVPHPPGYALWGWSSDPVVAVNEKTGDFWYCGLADVDATHNGIGVARGRFTGGVFAFDSVFIVRSALNSSFFLDKQWIAVDSLTGNLYVSATTFTVTGDQIDFYRSTNGGRTWSAAQLLSTAFDEGWVQGSRPAVGPNGEVYVVWSAIGQLNDFDYFRIRKSVEGGVSFAAEVNAADYISNYPSGAPGFNRDRGLTFPSITVDRTTGTNRGRVYVAWNESWDWLNDTFAALPVPPASSKSESDVAGNNTSNNTTATANPFTVGQVLRGTLQTTSSTTDLDYFSVPLNAGDRFFVWADSFGTGATPNNKIGAYTLRLFAPNPDGAQRLCYASKSDSASTQSSVLYVFMAPTTGTYYLRIAGVSRRTMGYRIRTTYGVRAGERGRDQRDAFVTSSDNGTTWATPTMLNADGTGFDNWLPEVGVGADGLPYGMWFDHRDDLYGSRAHVYMTRSTNGGTTWAINKVITSAQSNFTTAATNIQPNMGDYSHISAGTTRIHPTWSDGRAGNPSVDVFTTAVPTSSSILSCPDDTTMIAAGIASFGWTLQNDSPLFDGTYSVSVSSARAWPVSGNPTIVVPSQSSAFYTASVTVPDTAAAGSNTICFTFTTPGGVVVGQCCYEILVIPGELAVGDHLSGFALAPTWPNPTRGSARIAFSLPTSGHAKLTVYDLAGARVRTLIDANLPAGTNSIHWDGRDSNGTPVHAGAYFIRLDHAGRNLTQRLVMTK